MSYRLPADVQQKADAGELDVRDPDEIEVRRCVECGQWDAVEDIHDPGVWVCQDCGHRDGQQTLLPQALERDLEKGRELASEGQARALRAHVAAPWKERAAAWVATLPTGREFTADDMSEAVGLPSEGVNANNAVGALFSGLVRARTIEWTGRHVPSVRTVRHGNANRLWRKR